VHTTILNSDGFSFPPTPKQDLEFLNFGAWQRMLACESRVFPLHPAKHSPSPEPPPLFRISALDRQVVLRLQFHRSPHMLRLLMPTLKTLTMQGDAEMRVR